MRRQITGLHAKQQDQVNELQGLFLVRVEKASYHWHPQKPFLSLQFEILEPASLNSHSLSGRIYCTDRGLWKLNWFLHDFGYDPDLLSRDQLEEKALLNLRGVVRTSFTKLNGRSYQNLDAFAPAEEWTALPAESESQTGSEQSTDDI